MLRVVERFDQLVRAPAEREALDLLRSATGCVDGPMERHCLRVHHIAIKLAGSRGWTLDPEVIVVASILHDVGLYPSVSRGGVYTRDGAEIARELLERHGWSRGRVERCAQAIDRHHDVRGQLAQGPEVEALRLADLIDLGGGLLTFGISRRWLRDLNQTVRRRGLAGELARELGRALRQRPLTLVAIFRRP